MALEEKARRILDAHRIMAIATVRSDGWPQNTIVGYANEGLAVYFMVSPKSQKFANTSRDDRVSLAIASEPPELSKATAVFAAARASEVTEALERAHAWKLLMRRHPNLAAYELPDRSEAAMMRADCMHVSVLDYTVGLGHAEDFELASLAP